MTTQDEQRGFERAAAMFTAARAGDSAMLNRIGQEAADAGEFSLLCYSLCGLLNVALDSLATVTGTSVEALIGQMGIAIAER